MLLCKVFFVISAFSNNAWNSKTFVSAGTKSGEKVSRLHRAIEKSESVHVLGKELQYVAEIDKKLQN